MEKVKGGRIKGGRWGGMELGGNSEGEMETTILEQQFKKRKEVL